MLYLAVFDGLGGSGAERHQDPIDPETTVKAAYLASRRARDRTVAILERTDGSTLGPQLADLEESIRGGLEALRAEYPSSSRVKGSLKRAFPTTLAMIAAPDVHDGVSLCVEVAWAGDSRAFALEPKRGLLQLSRDHVQDEAADVLSNGGNAPMTRCMTPDEVAIAHHVVEVPAPCVVLVATDGCFGYVPSAMHFEMILLRTLIDAQDVQGWRERLIKAILDSTGDDATLALMAIGYECLDDVQDAFRFRSTFLAKHLAVTDLHNGDDLARMSSWYGHDYRSCMAAPELATEGEARATADGVHPPEEAAMDALMSSGDEDGACTHEEAVGGNTPGG